MYNSFYIHNFDQEVLEEEGHWPKSAILNFSMLYVCINDVKWWVRGFSLPHIRVQNYSNFIYWCEPKMAFEYLLKGFTHPLLFSVIKYMQLKFMLWMNIKHPTPNLPPPQTHTKWVTFKSLSMCRSIDSNLIQNSHSKMDTCKYSNPPPPLLPPTGKGF